MILCENGPGGGPALFSDARAVVSAHAAHEVAPALAALDAARAGGAWVAGWIAYEAGYALEPRLGPLMPPERDGPLLVCGVFDGPGDAGGWLAEAGSQEGAMAPPRPMVTRAEYGAAFARVKDWIAAGDIYQANLTFPLDSRLTAGTGPGLYARLRARQAVGHGAYADLGVGPVVLSRSPELFFSVAADGVISARPMKGTAPRDADPLRDAALAADLAQDDKARAENLMIVDLLRNDIGRIAEVGSVRVPELYAIESFTTVHQMSSRVVGRLAGAPGMAGLMTALFPCGSVTGAPKIRAMEVIHAVEPFPRGAYCGAVGWMAPDGRAAFNVAIRTLSLFPDGRIRLNVGGGVVQDSTEEGEWEEALWKARFATLPASA